MIDKERKDMNLGYVFEHGDGVLIATFMLLIAMSALSWYVIFWKAWMLKRERSAVTKFMQQSRAESGQVAELVRQWQSLQSTITQGESDMHRKEWAVMHLTQTLDVIRVKLDRGLTLLASVGSSAPFIGLFGTVWGIYGALTDIAAAGNASLNVVAGPMGEALVATAVGLFAAIPAVLAYNAYIRANRLLMQEYRHIAERFALNPANYSNMAPRDSIKLVSGE